MGKRLQKKEFGKMAGGERVTNRNGGSGESVMMMNRRIGIENDNIDC